MTGSYARLLRASLTNGKQVLSTGDKNLCHQQEPYIRWIWEDAKDHFYLAGFRTRENAEEYGKWKGWLK